MIAVVTTVSVVTRSLFILRHRRGPTLFFVPSASASVPPSSFAGLHALFLIGRYGEAAGGMCDLCLRRDFVWFCTMMWQEVARGGKRWQDPDEPRMA